MNTEDLNAINVMLVDDSAVIRGGLTRILEADPSVKIVASKANGLQAVESVEEIQPDLILLDIEMPVMDGLTALPKLLSKSPKSKIIIVSTLTEKGAAISMKALSLGALDCFVKPQSGAGTLGSDFQRDLLSRIKALAPAHKQASAMKTSPDNSGSTPVKTENIIPDPTNKAPVALYDKNTLYQGRPHLVMIGSSTGGPQALAKVAPYLRGLSAPVIITQHMPATFTKILAEHLHQQTGCPVYEGSDGLVVEAGNIYLAPGDYHMLLKKDGPQVKIKLDDGPQVNFCKPAVDPMFNSAIEIYGEKILAVMLTGMGQDGLDSSQNLVKRGGYLIAQNEETSVVWGMPGAVARAGICAEVLPIDQIGPRIKQSAA